MHVHAEASQVRSARTRCSGSAGSANSSHSRGEVERHLLGWVVGTGQLNLGDVSARWGRTGRLAAMRLGVLDVGSNTVHLLVVDAHPGAHPTPMHDHRAVLRLAEHVGDDDLLSKAGEKALLRAVQEACDQAEAQGCDELLALVTSAIREATNGLEVLDRIRERTGVELQVLSGEEEARLTFLAVRRWFGWSAGQLLVLDIGGGSLELASGIDEVPDVALSLPLGAGRMTRRFLPERPARAAAPTSRRWPSSTRTRRDLLEPAADEAARPPARPIWSPRPARRSAPSPGSPGPRRPRPGCGPPEALGDRPRAAGRVRLPDRVGRAGRTAGRFGQPRTSGPGRRRRGCRNIACAGRTVRPDLSVGAAGGCHPAPARLVGRGVMAVTDWNPDTGGRSLAEILREAGLESAARAKRRRSWDDPEEAGLRQRRAEAAADMSNRTGYGRRRSDLEDSELRVATRPRAAAPREPATVRDPRERRATSASPGRARAAATPRTLRDARRETAAARDRPPRRDRRDARGRPRARRDPGSPRDARGLRDARAPPAARGGRSLDGGDPGHAARPQARGARRGCRRPDPAAAVGRRAVHP